MIKKAIKNSIILTENGKYIKEEYILEKDLVYDIVEKSKEIFGEKIYYFNSEKLIKSKSGTGTRPDGFAIDLKKNILYVVEVELKSHSAKKHIFPQIQNFLLALNNPATKKPLIEFLINEFEKINIKKTFSEIENTFKNWKVLIIIDEISLELLEYLSSLFEFEKKIIIIPFQVYKNENDSKDKLHYFQSFDIESIKTEVARKWNFKWETVPIENHLKNVSENIKEIYEELSKKICNISLDIKEINRSKWATYQISKLKNFCTIKFFSEKLEIYIKVDENNFYDENKLCETIIRTSSWTFDKKIILKSSKNINYIIELIKQSHFYICKK